MAPPAKRRKRNVVEPSDDEDQEKPRINSLANFLSPSPEKNTAKSNGLKSAAASPSPVRTRSTTAAKSRAVASGFLPTRNRVSRVSTKSPSTSPEKSRARGTKTSFTDEKGNGDLRTLFSKQTQSLKSRLQQDNGRSKRPYDDDLIEDPISDEDDVSEAKASATSVVGQAARKRFKTAPQHPAASALPSASNQFLKPPQPPKSVDKDDDLRPWSERFAPVDLQELAVHPKKVKDVRTWLESVVNGNLRQRLLILKGAAGTGKTTTVRLLAKDMNCELLEWRNPTGAYGHTSASAQFEEFMSRGGKFGQLDFDTGLLQAQSGFGTTGEDDRKIILVEEFPNTFMRNSSPLQSFRRTILSYLAKHVPSLATFSMQKPKDLVTPVILVISETLLTTTSASADSFTAHRLLGPEILAHPGVGVIEFNKVAPTLMAGALEKVVVKEARQSGRRRTPGPQVLRQIAEIGDIRSAISSLEFLCVKGDDDADWGSKVAFTKPKRGGAKSAVSLTKGEQDSLELISQREASLGIFHAVGKVVYNKRDEKPFGTGTPEAIAETMPPYLSHASRPRRPQTCVNTLIDETGTDTGTFLSALHENYVPSCALPNPDDQYQSIEYVNGCIDYLSDSDLLCPSWDIFFGGKGYSGGYADTGSHILRQDEMGFQVAVRGLHYSLPFPVDRSAILSQGSSALKATNSQKSSFNVNVLYYPESIKLWRAKEELESVIDMWSSKLLKGDMNGNLTAIMDGAAAFRKSKTQPTGSWIDAQKLNAKPRPDKGQDTGNAALLSLGNSARKEMVLERLPYMKLIAGNKGSCGGIRVREFDRIVAFETAGTGRRQRAILKNGDDSEDDGREEMDCPGETWATDQPAEESTSRKKRAGIKSMRDGEVQGAIGQKWVLSDDDIED